MEKNLKSFVGFGARVLALVAIALSLGSTKEPLPKKDRTTSVRSNPQNSTTQRHKNTRFSRASVKRDSERRRESIQRDEGKILRFHGMKIKGLKPRAVTVYLPPGYDEYSQLRYPVLYAHDGQFVFQKELAIDRALERLVNNGIIEPHILVAIHRTNNRSRELKPGGRWRYHAPSLELYEKLLIDVIKPQIDERFRTRPDRESTAIIGYSLGGLANLYIMMRHSKIFGAVGCMSPSLWWKQGAALTEFRRYTGQLPSRLWIDAGTREGRPWETLPYFIRDIRLARGIARSKGMRLGEDLGYLEDFGVGHSGWAGGYRMRYALAFLLSRTSLGQQRPSSLSLGVFRDVLSVKRRSTMVSITAAYRHDDFRITWPNELIELSSSNLQVARVEKDGSLRATGLGTARISARFASLRAEQHIQVVSLRSKRWKLASLAEIIHR